MTNSIKPQRDSAVGPTVMQRWRGVRWVVLSLVVITALAALTIYLTAPRPGGPMEATSTSPEGARALVTLLRDHGVDVVVASNAAEVQRAARPGTLIAVLQTFQLLDDEGQHHPTHAPPPLHHGGTDSRITLWFY